jgi:hypothetical protein
MRDKNKKLRRIKFAREVDGCYDGIKVHFPIEHEASQCDKKAYIELRDQLRRQHHNQISLDESFELKSNEYHGLVEKFEIKTHTAPNGSIWTRVNIKPRKTVLNRLKSLWIYLTT